MRAALPELLVACSVVVIYLPALGFELVFDDRSLIGPDGPRALGNRLLPYRPLRYASLWLDHTVAGGAVWAYHTTNILLHAAASLLVVRLARRLGAGLVAATLAGLLFGLHPLAVEATAYVAGRRDLLATVCGLAALLAWTGRPVRMTLAVVLLMLGVAAKESALLVFPVILAASLLGFGPPLRLAWKPLAAAVLAALALPVAYGAAGPLAPSGLVTTAVVTGRVSEHYASGILLARGLSVEYPQLRCGGDCTVLWGGRAAAGLALALAAALAAAVLAWRVARGGGAANQRAAAALAFALCWAALVLVPIVAIIGTHEPGADRHAYPLLAALAVLAVTAAGRLGTVARTSVAVLAVLVLVALAGTTRARMRVWQDERTLWAATAATTPASARAHHNLAGVLAEAGELRAARRQLRFARAADRDYAPALAGLASVACARGRYAKARAYIAKARARGVGEEMVAAVERDCHGGGTAR